MKRGPPFTDEHYRAIHHALFTLPWQENRYYEERREVIAMLGKYFGAELEHLVVNEKRTNTGEKP
jgi:hypothetical protein